MFYLTTHSTHFIYGYMALIVIVVRASTHGAMWRQRVSSFVSASLNKTLPSCLDCYYISRSSQCPTTGVTKAVVAYVLSCLWDGAYKRTLAVNVKE